MALSQTLLPSCGQLGVMQHYTSLSGDECHEHVPLCESLSSCCSFKTLPLQHEKPFRRIFGYLDSLFLYQSLRSGNSLSDVKPHLIYRWGKCVLFTVLPTLQVKFQSFLLLSGLHETQQILTGAGSRWAQWILTFRFQLGCVSPCRRIICSPSAVVLHVCVSVCVSGHMMRRLPLLLLGLLLLQQGRCFEFVIDGEWEEETVSLSLWKKLFTQLYRRSLADCLDWKCCKIRMNPAVFDFWLERKCTCIYILMSRLSICWWFLAFTDKNVNCMIFAWIKWIYCLVLPLFQDQQITLHII